MKAKVNGIASLAFAEVSSLRRGEFVISSSSAYCGIA